MLEQLVLLRRGLRIPDDLSPGCLSNDLAAERLSPLPDRYDLAVMVSFGDFLIL